MMNEKERIENLINFSKLFDLDKATNPSRFDTEKRKLLANLFEYYKKFVYPNKPTEKYHYELMLAADACVGAYKKEQGEFLHYLSIAFENERLKAKGKKAKDRVRRGGTIGNKWEKLIGKILKLAKSLGRDLEDAEFQMMAASKFELDLKHIQKAVRLNSEAVALSDRTTNSDGEELSLFDTISSKNSSAEDDIILNEKTEDKGRSSFFSFEEFNSRLSLVYVTRFSPCSCKSLFSFSNTVCSPPPIW
jgi:hypothetical protein